MRWLNPHGIPWDEWALMHVREILAVVVVLVLAFLGLRHVELPGGTVLTGKVSSQGKPVVFGTVTVIASDNRTFTVPIGPDGTYTLRNLPAGPVRVAVSSPNPRSVIERQEGGVPATGGPAAATPGTDRNKQGGPSRPGQKPGGGRGGSGDEEAADGTSIAAPEATSPAEATAVRPGPPVPQAAAAPSAAGWFRIPGRYASPATSGLKTDVQRGKTKLDLSLE